MEGGNEDMKEDMKKDEEKKEKRLQKNETGEYKKELSNLFQDVWLHFVHDGKLAGRNRVFVY